MGSEIISPVDDHPLTTFSACRNGVKWLCRTMDGMQWHVRADCFDVLFAENKISPAESPIARWIKRNELTRVKSGPMRSTSRLNVESREFFVKQFFTPDWRSIARSFLRGGQARWEAARIRLLMEHGVATGALVAFAQPNGWWQRGEGVLITESLGETKPLFETLAIVREAGHDVRNQLIEATAELVAKLHSANLIHYDLHSGNIFVRREGTEWKMWLLDLNRLRKTLGEPSESQIASDLALLRQTSSFYTNERDWLRFWNHYWKCRSEISGRTPSICSSDRHRGAKAILERSIRFSERFVDGLDRRWNNGNHHQMEVHFGAIRCRAVSWLGRDLIEHHILHDVFNMKAIATSDNPSWRTTTEIETPRGKFKVSVTHLSQTERLTARCSGDLVNEAWNTGYALRRRAFPCAEPLVAAVRQEGEASEYVFVSRHTSGWQPLQSFISNRDIISQDGPMTTLREIGHRIARLLRALHDSGFVHRLCSVDDFAAIAGPVPLAATDLSQPNPFWGVLLTRSELIEKKTQLSQEQVVLSISHLLKSVKYTSSPFVQISNSELLGWLLAYLPRSERTHWKNWWRCISKAVLRLDQPREMTT